MFIYYKLESGTIVNLANMEYMTADRIVFSTHRCEISHGERREIDEFLRKHFGK